MSHRHVPIWYLGRFVCAVCGRWGRVRLALWLIHRDRMHPWRRLLFRFGVAR